MSLFLSILTLLVCIIWLLIEFRRNGFTLLFMSLVWIVVLYCLSPIALIISYENVASPRFLNNRYQLSSIFPQLVIILFIISFYFGASVGKLFKYSIVLNTSDRTAKIASFILMLIGLFSLYFYIYSYGGLAYVLEYMSKIRSGTADVKNYLAAFVYSFSKYLNLGFLILFSLFLMKKLDNLYLKFLLIITFIICLFSIYISAGREAGISFLISIAVIFLYVKKKIPVVTTSLMIILSLFYIIFGKIFLFALKSESFDSENFIKNEFFKTLANSYNLIIKEFTHQYLSLVNFLQGDYPLRFFGDYLYWVLKPLKLIGMDVPDSISYYNTYIVYGVWDSEIPPGAVAFGYISLGAIGVVVHGFILGAILRGIDRFFMPKTQVNSILLGYYALLVSSFTYLISNSDPALFLQNRIPHFLFFITLLMIFKVKFLKKIR